jgi:hypothetical protein
MHLDRPNVAGEREGRLIQRVFGDQPALLLALQRNDGPAAPRALKVHQSAREHSVRTPDERDSGAGHGRDESEAQ